ncbi:site-specific integrase [uncultured Rikenella sp.]|uniref:site-specific integrase n=1 Tax=uncultured Rikenella sp. TaxID=368003 RepID=UPI00272A9BDE|nr:site-specific integrase [uncultured Rikenella sp.]
MLQYATDGITVASILDTRKANQAGTYPVKIRVTYKRVRRYYSTGKSLMPEEWEKLPATKSYLYSEVRRDIITSFELIKKAVQSLAERGEFTFNNLDLRLGRAVTGAINDAFRAKIEALQEEERIGSMLAYKDTLRVVEEFAGEGIDFSSITPEWLRRFEHHLLETKNLTTVGIHCRNIRAILNEARRAGIVKESQYPFGRGRYEIKVGVSHKKALTLEQIGQVVKYTDGTEATEKYRDLWFFIYLCNGINVADLVRLRYRNIIDGEVCFVRQKTQRTTATIREVRATLTPEMQAIIDRWGNPPEPDNFIFPYLNGTEDAMRCKVITTDLTRRINKRMKRIGEAVGIDGISTYTARHSFATVLKRSGANIAFISESLGHNDLKTTEHYLASFEKEERQKNANLLTQFE